MVEGVCGGTTRATPVTIEVGAVRSARLEHLCMYTYDLDSSRLTQREEVVDCLDFREKDGDDRESVDVDLVYAVNLALTTQNINLVNAANLRCQLSMST